MHAPKYDGLLEPWKIELIGQRARRLGIRPQDVADLTQELVVELLSFTYRPDPQGPAQERTVLQALIDHHLAKRHRTARRYRVHLERAARQRGEATDGDPSAMALDVRMATARLSRQDQAICQALAQGHSPAAIAEAFGCSWHTVARAIRRIRRHFQAIGLGGWIGQ